MPMKSMKEKDENSNQEPSLKTEKIGLAKEELQDKERKRLKKKQDKIDYNKPPAEKATWHYKLTIQLNKLGKLYSKFITNWVRGEFAILLNSLLHFSTATIIIFTLGYAAISMIRLPLQWYTPLIGLAITIVAGYINEKS